MSTNPKRVGISGRTVFRAGIGLVLVGVLFLLKYSIDQGWFGPETRLIFGGALSVALVIVGVTLPRPLYGRLLQGAGVAGGYATVWTAHVRYELVDGPTALIQLITVAAVGVSLAWREESDGLSALGLLGAVVAPIAVGGGLASQTADLLYLIGFMALAATLYVVRKWTLSWAVVVASTGVALAVEVAVGEPTALLGLGIALWWLTGWALPNLQRFVGLDDGSEILTIATLPVPVGAWIGFLVAFEDQAALVAAILGLVHLATWVGSREVRTDAVLQLLMTYGFASVVLVDRFEVATAVPVYLLLTMAVALYGSRSEDATTMIVGYALAVPALALWLTVIEGPGSFEWIDAVRDLASVAVVAAAAILSRPGPRVAPGATAYVMAVLWLARYPGEIDTGWTTAGLAVLGVVTLVAGRLSGGRLVV